MIPTSRAICFEIFNDQDTHVEMGAESISQSSYMIRASHVQGDTFTLVRMGYSPRRYRLTSTQLVDALTDWIKHNEETV